MKNYLAPLLSLFLILMASQAFADAESCAQSFELRARKLERAEALFALPPALEIAALAAWKLKVPYASPLYGASLILDLVWLPAGLLAFDIARQERTLAGTIREALSGVPGPASERTARRIRRAMNGATMFVETNAVGPGYEYPDYQSLAAKFPRRNLNAQTIANATRILIERNSLCAPGREKEEFRFYVPNMSAVLAEMGEPQ